MSNRAKSLIYQHVIDLTPPQILDENACGTSMQWVPINLENLKRGSDGFAPRLSRSVEAIILHLVLRDLAVFK